MKLFLAVCVVVFVMGLLVSPQSQAKPLRILSLGCDFPLKTETNEEHEAKALRNENLVKRKSPHELVVMAGSKILSFKDEPPFDAELDNRTYTFCDHHDGYILILHEDRGLFTGKLVDERTGRILPGGQEVIFSPSRNTYFVSEQEDGMEGQIWKIYASKSGKVLWTGSSAIEKEPKGGVAEVLSEPDWARSGVLIAAASCDSDLTNKTSQVKLKKVNGTFVWRPELKCGK